MKLLEEIKLPHEATKKEMQGLVAEKVKHEISTKRMEDMQEVHIVLQGLVRSETATKLVAEVLENI